MVTSRPRVLLLLLVLLGCCGDLSPATLLSSASADILADDGDRTIAPPLFLGAAATVNFTPTPPPLLLLLLLLRVALAMVLVMRDAADGDLAEGDVSLSVGESASCRKILSLRRRYHSSA